MENQDLYIWDTLGALAQKTLSDWIETNNAKAKLIKPAKIEVLAKFILENRLFDNSQQNIVFLREWGEPISKETRKELGISSRAILGHAFVDCLEGFGLRAAAENARAICHWVWHINSQYFMQRLIKESGALMYYRIEHWSCCNAAKKFQFGVGDVEDFEGFPIDGCDKIQCTCNIERYSPQWHGDIQNDLRTIKPKPSLFEQIFGKK